MIQATQQAPFPTEAQLEHMGLVRCQVQPCTAWVDPANVPERTCRHHQLQQRRKRREQRQSRAPYLARERGAA